LSRLPGPGSGGQTHSEAAAETMLLLGGMGWNCTA
jgi:hypothetical protein